MSSITVSTKKGNGINQSTVVKVIETPDAPELAETEPTASTSTLTKALNYLKAKLTA